MANYRGLTDYIRVQSAELFTFFCQLSVPKWTRAKFPGSNSSPTPIVFGLNLNKLCTTTLKPTMRTHGKNNNITRFTICIRRNNNNIYIYIRAHMTIKRYIIVYGHNIIIYVFDLYILRWECIDFKNYLSIYIYVFIFWKNRTILIQCIRFLIYPINRWSQNSARSHYFDLCW